MATGSQSKVGKVAYRFQRAYAGLQTGHSLTVQQSKRGDLTRPFMAQSDLDSACGTHILAAILVIFDLAKASALHEMSRRKYGVAAEVWQAFQHTYFTGVNAKEWVALVNSLNLPLRLTAKYGTDDNADGHAVNWLMHGDLVALAFASVKHQRTKHWTVATSIEGAVIDKVHHPDTIQMLDPSAGEPSFQTFNSRLRLPPTSPGSGRAKTNFVATDRASKRKPVSWLYEAMEWNAEEVHLLAAVRLQLTT